MTKEALEVLDSLTDLATREYVAPYFFAGNYTAGAILASAALYVIASGRAGFGLEGGFAANGYGIHSPGSYSLQDVDREIDADEQC